MKQDKQKKNKKLNQGSIREELIGRINQSVEALGFSSKKLQEEVEKSARRIAKKIVKSSKKKSEGLHEIVKAADESRKGYHDFERPVNIPDRKETRADSPVPEAEGEHSNIVRDEKNVNKNANVDLLALASENEGDKKEKDTLGLDGQIGSLS